MEDPRPLIPKHGGYRHLHCFKLGEVVYDATHIFVERFLVPRSRLAEQMIHAARSGRQNIAEGSIDSAISKRSEMKLTGIARGSLVELQLDYEDYLRQHAMALWHKDDPRCVKVRDTSRNPTTCDRPGQRSRYRSDINFELYRKYFEKTSAEIAANAAICVCHQATYLLNRLLTRLERDFVAQGGFTERLHRVRTEARNTTRKPEP